MELEDIDMDNWSKATSDLDQIPDGIKCCLESCRRLLGNNEKILVRRKEEGTEVVCGRCRKTKRSKQRNANLGRFA